MSRFVMLTSALLWVVVWSGPAPLRAAEHPFELPDCVADLGTDVVLNATLMDAMIGAAAPDGARPDPQQERRFVVLKHYLDQSRSLLVLARQDPSQRPLLLTHACQPYPDAPAHIRAYVADLTAAAVEALITYRDLVWPRRQGPRPRPGAMVRIPAGPFTRGDGSSVRLDAFAIDVYEVTNAQFREFIAADGYTTRDLWSDDGWAWLQKVTRRQPSYWDEPQLNGPDQPVVGVSWYEAEAYCRWAGKALPTELQWEKACRGPDGRKYPWGNEPLPTPAAAPSPAAGTRSFAAPAPVGSAPEAQSPYGVHDLAGNVLEWTQTRRQSGQTVLCGGSGDPHAADVGCDVRYTLLPGIAANFIGFRCQALAPDSP